MDTMTHIPATLVTKRGAGFLIDQVEGKTAVITNHSKPAAVVMSPKKFDDIQRELRAASNTLIETAADLVAERSTFHSIDDAKEMIRARR